MVNEKTIKDMVYIIRGQKVMLDYELAKIYGYEVKTFNRQVKNNIDKFDADFMFQISKAEFEQLVRCKNFTSRSMLKGNNGGRRYLPYAFTEQGIYMLMTVLKGNLATQQSKALIRLFKKMKDYINNNDALLSTNIEERLINNEKRIDVIENKLDIIMNNFSEPAADFKHFVIHQGERIESDIAYQTIYGSANKSIILIDDYISLKTLELMKICSPNICITIISDNVSKENITDSMLEDFLKDTGISILLIPSHKKVHDRYIVIDYKSGDEKLYHAGASSKDSGNKLTSIMEDEHPTCCHEWIDDLLSNQ